MIRGVPFLDGYKRAPACRAYLFIRYQFRLDGGTVFFRFDDTGLQFDQFVDGRWPKQLYVKIGGHSAVGGFFAVAFHHEMGRGPIRMAVEKRSDYSAIDHTRKCLMVWLSPPFGDDLVTFRNAVDMQPLIVRRAAAKADTIGRILLLERFVVSHSSNSTTQLLPE
jgi:hypothetical protein